MSKGIAAGLLIAAIGTRPGSATALKTIVRGGSDNFRRNDSWSSQEQTILESIDKKQIDACDLRLEPSKETSPIIPQLWIGPRKFGKAQRDKIKEPFRSACLRVAAFRTTDPPMKSLDNAWSDH
jgi:hypothetical protein